MIINNITNIKKKNKYLLSQITEHTHKKKIKSVFCLMTNGKKDKMTNNDLQHTTNKAEVWVTQTHYNRDWNQVILKGQQFMLHM
jgi:hypothetical protein